MNKTLQQLTIEALSGETTNLVSQVRQMAVDLSKLKIGGAQKGIASQMGQLWIESNNVNQRELAAALVYFSFYKHVAVGPGLNSFTHDMTMDRVELRIENNELHVYVFQPRMQTDLLTGKSTLTGFDLEGELLWGDHLLKNWARENSKLEKKREALPLGADIPRWLDPVEANDCVSRFRILQAMLTPGGVYLHAFGDTSDVVKRLVQSTQNDLAMRLGVPFDALVDRSA